MEITSTVVRESKIHSASCIGGWRICMSIECLLDNMLIKSDRWSSAAFVGIQFDMDMCFAMLLNVEPSGNGFPVEGRWRRFSHVYAMSGSRGELREDTLSRKGSNVLSNSELY